MYRKNGKKENKIGLGEGWFVNDANGSFHKIKTEILKNAPPGYAKVVGINPDLTVENGWITLRCATNRKKTIPTELSPDAFFYKWIDKN